MADLDEKTNAVVHQTDDVLPELNCFFISASRHDRDRIELQLGFDGLLKSNEDDFTYDIDFVLFTPKSLGLREVEGSQQLRQEFQSYIRLHTHTSNPDSQTSILRVRDRLGQLQVNPSIGNIRLFAIEFDGFLKAQIKKLRRDFATVVDEKDRLALRHSIEDLRSLMAQMRAILKQHGVQGSVAEDHRPQSIERNLLLLNEYISHDYVHLLVQTHYAAIEASDRMSELLPILDEIARTEAQTRRLYHLPLEERRGPTSSQEIDNYPRRVSLLKKYFQKTLFVDVDSEGLQDRLLLPVWGISAALAAAFAIMVQIYQARSVAERVGINSVAVITVGVLAYVAKDIMKNFLRMSLLKPGASRFFADYKKTLWVKREDGRKKLGNIEEYVRLFDSEKLPEDLATVRYANVGGDMEQALHEDILQFRKKVTLQLSQLETNREFPWGIREIVRFRFDRLLTNMEDAFKTLHLLSATGAPTIRQGHRLYHLYLATWIRRSESDGPTLRPSFQAFRISLDKTGVLACDPVEWRGEAGIPNPPR